MLAEKTIRKHVVIIHAYSLMSVLQRKIMNVLLYEASKSNNRLNTQNSVAVECQIPFSILCKTLKFKSNNTQYLKEAVDGLASLKIEWNLLKDKVPTDISFLNLRILHGAPTFYQDNTLNFSFHKVMLDLVENPSIYGTLDIDLQSEFESKYSHALYENSTRFMNLQKNKIVELAVFRKLLGVKENKYPSMRELTRNVVSPAIEEVNDRANFIVNLEAVKSGRKTIGFEVSVTNKKKANTQENPLNNLENEKIDNEVKQTFGMITKSVLQNIINNYSEEYILEKINYTKKCAKKESTGFYPVPYFISAIKHDYKFKEEPAYQETKEKPLVAKDEWGIKLRSLVTDLNHWKKLFAYANETSNEVQIKYMTNLIVECEEKIRKHYLEQPPQKEIL